MSDLTPGRGTQDEMRILFSSPPHHVPSPLSLFSPRQLSFSILCFLQAARLFTRSRSSLDVLSFLALFCFAKTLSARTYCRF